MTQSVAKYPFDGASNVLASDRPGGRPHSSGGVTLRSRALNLLKNAIMNGEFSPGQKLTERELSDMTGASRSVLREALVNLEANGLVERQSYCGYSVAQLTSRSVSEIFELRFSLETQAAELFTERASDIELDLLQIRFDELAECIDVQDSEFSVEKMRQAKGAYYDVLFTGCRNREIRRALEMIIYRVSYLRSRLMSDPRRRHASLGEMRALTKALIERDGLAARQASMNHLTHARDAVLYTMLKKQEGMSSVSSLPAQPKSGSAGVE